MTEVRVVRCTARRAHLEQRRLVRKERRVEVARRLERVRLTGRVQHPVLLA
jgi:hypothetical protein